MAQLNAVRFLNRTSPPHIATLVLLSGMSALTMSVFLPSLPEMTEYFDTEYRLLQLSVAIYLGVNALLQIFVGPLSDKMGRRPVILGGIAVFLVATVGCLLSENVYVFLFFRMIQAAIVVAMALSRAVVRDMYPPDEAASMIGYVTMGMAVVPMIAPGVGGFLGEFFGWQASFWLMLALGGLTFVLCWLDLGETATKSGLTLARQFGEYPELLGSPRFWGYALACAFSSGTFFSYLGGAPFVGSEMFKLDPALLGFYLGSPAIGYGLGNFLSGRYSARMGIDWMVHWGAIIVTIGVLLPMLFVYLGMNTANVFFGFMTLVGLGNGLVIPNSTAGFLSVRPHLAGTASGLGGAIMIGGGALLSALAGSLLHEDTGAWPLLWLMLISAFSSWVAIVLVIRRKRSLGGLDGVS